MNRNVFITGASRGLGFGFVRKYLEEGDTVFAGVRDISSSQLLLLKETYADKLIIVPLELSDTISVNKAAEIVSSYTDTLDIIINDAAIHSSTSYEVLEEADIDDCLQVYNVGSLGALRVVKAFLTPLRKSKKAKIINISSDSGCITTCHREKEFDYCMAKAALNMMTMLLTNYLKKDNIIVFSVHPGWMRTEMGGQNAHYDPYENACSLVDRFDTINDLDHPKFFDNHGNNLPW